MRNGSNVFNDFFIGHPNPIVGDGEGLRPFVCIKTDLKSCWRGGQQRGVHDAFELQFLNRIGCIGDELSEEDLSVGVEGMDHEIQNFFCFGLECLSLLCHGAINGTDSGFVKFEWGLPAPKTATQGAAN